MPPFTRSFHHFANTILNNIIHNVVNHSNNSEKGISNSISNNTNDLDHSFAEVDGTGATTSASLGLGCCSICCDDIQFDKGRFVLECGHTFHARCILVEFRHRNRCPMCRTEVKESSAHERSYIMPGSLRIYSSILHDAADHFIHDLGNITFANVVHRMMLLSSEDQDIRRIQYPYIKRLLVQFASIFVRGIAFSIRDRDDEVAADPVPIDIIDNMMDVDGLNNDSEYDAAISNPALDAAVAYHAMVTTDMNFDSSSSIHDQNVSSVLIRRSVALAEMGLQRSELSLRRSRILALRHQQLEEVQRLLQEAIEERQQREQAEIAHNTNGPNEQNQEATIQAHVNMVISENQNPLEENDDDDDEQSPWGIQF